MKIHDVFSTKINQLWSRESPAIVVIVLGQASNLFLFVIDGKKWKEHSLSKDVDALPKIWPYSQLESDG